MTAKKQPFEAEVGRVLDLVINSLYQHRDIFLRELISNASDACDRLRYAAISDGDLLKGDPDLKITLTPDKSAGTLTIEDNGLGMTRKDLIDNLGTIARSGTARFANALSGDAKADVNLIGQFGVGFYSAFMVADRVEVVSTKAGDTKSYCWTSDGKSGFSIEKLPDPAARGTRIVLHLREDAKEFLDEYRIRHIVRSYSDHIAMPIMFQGEAVPAEADSDGNVDQLLEVPEPEQINEANALWTRPKSEITDEQYKEFYHHAGHAFDDPWARLHVQAEGLVSYQALLFVPSVQPMDLFDPKREHGVKLYVKRVFITDGLDGLMPRYLRFVKGVIDTEDLELNVSRETLQHSAVLAKIRKDLVKRILDELTKRAKAEANEDNGGGYDTFWEQFGQVIKEGIYEDHEQREKLLELARFRSTHDDGWVSLAAYVERMKPGQDAIYTISGENLTALKSSPQLEAARAKGVEVLLLADNIDDFWLPQVDKYQDMPFRSLTRGDIDLSKIEGEADAEKDDGAKKVEGEELDKLIATLKAKLGDKVADVRASARLTDSAVCLVADETGMDMRLERFLKQHQQLGELSKRILEINPKHDLIKRMAAADPASDELGELAELLFDQALIIEGEPLPDPGAFSRRMSAFLTKGLAA
ncbi:MAG: molecular chaperone HtpG [Alphaproteobacteria bacterium]|nr:molecular chaperone HtpG [Alphaproteobacteria bacterium]